MLFGPGHRAMNEGDADAMGDPRQGTLHDLRQPRRFRQQGLEWCVLTDVARDGVGAGVNVASALALQSASGLKVVASGGVTSLEDVQHVREAGLAGVIIGRALYDAKISLKDCFAGEA